MAGSSERKAATDAGASSRPATRAKTPGHPRSLWWRLPSYAIEGVAAVVLTLVCFSGFLWVLTFAFPAGQDFRSLLAARLTRATESISDAARSRLGGVALARSVAQVLASLEVIRTAVRTREVGTITWIAATNARDLHAGDAVQTGDEGRARLTFSEDRVEMGENTMIVLGSGERVGGTDPSRPVVMSGFALLEGEVTARVSGSRGKPLSVDLPQGVALIDAGNGSTPTDVRVSLRPDRSSWITVVSGAASVEAGGKTVKVRAGQRTGLDQEGRALAPRALPAAPQPTEPADGATFAFLDLPPKVTFRWNSAKPEGEWRLRVARDRAFGDVVVEETARTPELEWGRLKPGTYHWQVVAVDDGLEGMPAESRRLVVKREEHPLVLTVAPLPDRVSGLACTVQGSVNRKASVYVMGHPASVARDGSFSENVDLKPGANVVLVEAVDAAGTTTYSSSVVHAKP